jgi:hypothetical protein
MATNSRSFERLAIVFRVNAALRLLLMAGTIFGGNTSAQDVPHAKEWPATAPAAVGLDATVLATLDADLASGKYGLADSMLVIRCGKQAFEHAYVRDYSKIYGQRAKTTGPLNHDLHGPYNYFSTEFHPYYRRSDQHTNAVGVEDGDVGHHGHCDAARRIQGRPRRPGPEIF